MHLVFQVPGLGGGGPCPVLPLQAQGPHELQLHMVGASP